MFKYKNMIKFNNTILVPSFNDTCRLLSNKPNTNINTNYMCSEKIAIMHYNINYMNVVRIWKTNSFLNYWYTDFTNSSRQDQVAAFDYIINEDDTIKIDFMYINDEASSYENNSNYLSDYEANQIKKAIFEYIKNIAKENNKIKIIVDVHNNLKIYNKYYAPEGFQLTDQKSLDNRYWIISEKVLN
jgi:hypothetical protein